MKRKRMIRCCSRTKMERWVAVENPFSVRVGPWFVVHPAVSGSLPVGGWTVNHAPSGTAVGKGYPTRRAAIYAARRLYQVRLPWGASQRRINSVARPVDKLIIRRIAAGAQCGCRP